MNKLTIIGNLTADPEMRTTQDGKNVCSFTVAVNKRNKETADFFKVSAWRQLGENCQKFLTKGRKVCVVGSVSAHAYTNSKGEAKASMEVTAEDVEFVSSPAENVDKQSGMQKVQPEDNPFDRELPF